MNQYWYIFLLISLGFCFWKENYRVKEPFHHISRLPITVGVELNHLAEIVFFLISPLRSYLSVMPTPSCSLHYTLKEKSLCTGQIQGVENYAPLPWGQNICTNYLEFSFCTWGLFPLPHSIILSVIHLLIHSLWFISKDSCIFILYLNCNPIPPYPFCWSNFSSFGIGSSFSLLLFPFDVPTSTLGLFSFSFWLRSCFWHYKIL